MGTLLYLLFVNDLPDIITNGIKNGADDTKVWGPVKTGRWKCMATSPDSANGHRSVNYNTYSVDKCSLKPGMFPIQ